ncbi:MAG: protein translocase subunit SecD [Deltaproteobacteria bacterium]|uniref:Protein translocase subunit SecD n=1 Tax=Candidatus Zymogenus saltonus TaxID=2844893 RepID=A0A9D8KDQ4_9DELT|nr:protein translocase subunit SecD [Candidatus Zymogenus saltonus]
MIKDLNIRIAIIVVVVLVSVVYLTPTFFFDGGGKVPDFWKKAKILPTKTLNRGLDLEGGMHMLLGVDLEESLINTMDRMTVEIKTYLDKEEIPYRHVERHGTDGIRIVLTDPEKQDDLKAYINKTYRFFEIVETSTLGGEFEVTYKYREKDLLAFKDRTVDQTLETIRNRVDELGLAEPEIVRQGDYDILVQLPGLADAEKAKSLIKKVALLEFKLVDDKNDLAEALKGNVPEGSEILYQKIKDRDTGELLETKPYLIEKKTLMTGEVITDANISISSSGRGYPHVAMNFDSRGEALFEKISGDNVGRNLAIILDNSVYSAPVIKTKISGGSAIIEGSFTKEEASELAIVLRAGALPAKITVHEERTVGPSLGEDSIRKGFMATLIGSALVIIAMVLYYGASGLVADLALFLNMIIILAVMSALQATLTLPGIAGIALTIGMAVDANVLVFERVREELRLGKTPRAALEGGYSKAFLTIMDANVTTLIAALVLFQFGTGPVKGFAVTLSIGILTSLFTAIFVSRTIFDLVTSRFRIKRLSV